MDKYVPRGPLALNATGYKQKLLNRRVQVGWDEDAKSWALHFRGLVSRKDRKINRISLALSDEAMRAMVEMVSCVYSDRDYRPEGGKV